MERSHGFLFPPTSGDSKQRGSKLSRDVCSCAETKTTLRHCRSAHIDKVSSHALLHVFLLSLGAFFTIKILYRQRQSQCNPKHCFYSKGLSVAPSLYLLFRSLQSFLSCAFCRALAEGNMPRLLFPAGACCLLSSRAGKDNSGVNHIAPPMKND